MQILQADLLMLSMGEVVAKTVQILHSFLLHCMEPHPCKPSRPVQSQFLVSLLTLQAGFWTGGFSHVLVEIRFICDHTVRKLSSKPLKVFIIFLFHLYKLNHPNQPFKESATSSKNKEKFPFTLISIPKQFFSLKQIFPESSFTYLREQNPKHEFKMTDLVGFTFQK